MFDVQAAAPSVRPPKTPRVSSSPEASGTPHLLLVLPAPWVQWLEGSPILWGLGADSQLPWEQVGQACVIACMQSMLGTTSSTVALLCQRLANGLQPVGMCGQLARGAWGCRCCGDALGDEMLICSPALLTWQTTMHCRSYCICFAPVQL